MDDRPRRGDVLYAAARDVTERRDAEDAQRRARRESGVAFEDSADRAVALAGMDDSMILTTAEARPGTPSSARPA